ncbi:beta/gamma crystallin domain-containing protein [Streptomyces sp. NPDC055607]|nr:hypothetical protein [Streptomyces sp. SID2131]
MSAGRGRRSVVVAGLAVAALLAGTVPAAATNEVDFFHCQADFNGEYLQFGIRNPNGTGTLRCFANAGDLAVGQGGVERFGSGNNAGWFEYEPGDGWRYRHTFGKWERITKDYGHVTHLHID